MLTVTLEYLRLSGAQKSLFQLELKFKLSLE